MNTYAARMSPTLSGSSALLCFEHDRNTQRDNVQSLLGVRHTFQEVLTVIEAHSMWLYLELCCDRTQTSTWHICVLTSESNLWPGNEATVKCG